MAQKRGTGSGKRIGPAEHARLPQGRPRRLATAFGLRKAQQVCIGLVISGVVPFGGLLALVLVHKSWRYKNPRRVGSNFHGVRLSYS